MAKFPKHYVTSLSYCVLAVMICLVPVRADEEAFAPARHHIEDFHATLLMVMKSGSDFDARYETLLPVVTRLFDFDNICRVIFSRHWKQLESSTQADVKQLMVELTVSQYASHFSSFNQEQFSVRAIEKSRRDRIVIKTELETADKEIIHLDYLMHKVDDEWKTISVIANGVNDLALKRSEYSDAIEKNGVSALMLKISEKINKFRNP